MHDHTNEFVINFHLTEVCNYGCAYCYAKWNEKPSKFEIYRESGKVEELLRKLADYFFKANSIQKVLKYKKVRINFAGGEPTLLGKHFINALETAKSLGFQTSVITNGHYLQGTLLREASPLLDMLGISFDTADQLTAHSIGRNDRKHKWFSSECLLKITSTYKQLNPSGRLKVNTVINPYNFRENMSGLISQLKLDKWKVLRVLPVHDVNQVITDEQYQSFISRHMETCPELVVEDNSSMWHSYLMINPQGKFYQNNGPAQGHLESDPILRVGVSEALKQVPFNEIAFAKRYD